MNLSEFKAWFEGFAEGIEDRPTKKQWERVKERASEIVSYATPYPVFIDRYVQTYPYWHWQNSVWISPANGGFGASCANVQSNNLVQSMAQHGGGTANRTISTEPMVTPTAMFIDLGRADFAALN